MTNINRAYSMLTVKSVEEDGDERVIRGVATTPNPDRVGDVVEPLGVEFKNPMPLLWQHDSHKPVGLVSFDKPTKKGITFEARLPKIAEVGVLKDRVDEAWQSVKAGLVRAVSIGFRALEYSIMDEGGYKFLKSEVMELSLVTIPANADATISTIKQFDTGLSKAATTLPGVTGKNVTKTKGRSAVKSIMENKMNTKTYADQISAFESTRVAKSTEMESLLDAASEAGETLDGEQSELYDTLAEEIKAIDKHIDRLKAAEKLSASRATPVEDGKSQKGASDARAGVVIKNTRKQEPGTEFTQFVMALGAAKGNIPQAFEIAKQRFGESADVVTSLKAAVAAGTTTDPTWAAPLVDTYQRFAGDFVEFLRPQTILGKFGVNGVPSLRRVPFNISIPTQTSGGQGYWVGEAQPKPLTKFDFGEINLRWAKVANIAVITEELLRFSNPAAESIVRDQLAAALIARLDTDFVDPAKAAVANVSPASITNGVTPITSSGTDADAVRADLKGLMATYLAANINPSTGVFIMPSMIALSLSLMTNPLGQNEFPGITMNGGSFNGMPVIVSDYVPAGTVILANAGDIYLADDGQVMVDASREASLQMLDNPTNSPFWGPTGVSGATNPTSLVSMFQTNSVAIRAERWINWQKRRAQAVAVLTDVEWGGAPTT